MLYTIRVQVFEQVDYHPYLGVELSQNLSCTTGQSVSKAQKYLNPIRRSIMEGSHITKQRAYNELVRPTLEHASIV